jgi:hypothetical protein
MLINAVGLPALKELAGTQTIDELVQGVCAVSYN